MKNMFPNLRTAVPAVIAIIALLAMTMFIFGSGSTQSMQVNPDLTRSNSATLESGLTILSTGTSVERAAAARIFGEHPPAVSSTIVQGLGRALMYDGDVRVRSAVAASVGQSRRKCEPGTRVYNEPQLLEIMLTAYQQEVDAGVRREIVRAVGEFDHADAATVINLALEDQDSSVREAAAHVKILREQRLMRARTG